MSTTQNDTYLIGGTMITLAALGASVFPTVIKSPSISGGQIIVSTLGSGATVCLLPLAIPGLNIAGATAIGASIAGFPISTTQGFSWEGPAAFYLASATAASTVQCLFKYSSQTGPLGATLA